MVATVAQEPTLGKAFLGRKDRAVRDQVTHKGGVVPVGVKERRQKGGRIDNVVGIRAKDSPRLFEGQV